MEQQNNWGVVAAWVAVGISLLSQFFTAQKTKTDKIKEDSKLISEINQVKLELKLYKESNDKALKEMKFELTELSRDIKKYLGNK